MRSNNSTGFCVGYPVLSRAFGVEKGNVPDIGKGDALLRVTIYNCPGRVSVVRRLAVFVALASLEYLVNVGRRRVFAVYRIE